MKLNLRGEGYHPCFIGGKAPDGRGDGTARSAWNTTVRALPGSPAVETPSFLCKEHGFQPWSGNQDPTGRAARPR